MPRYFLDIQHGGTIARSAEGQELPDLDAAREEAFTSARQMIANALLDGSSLKQALCGTIIVRSEGGEALLSASFMASVKETTAARPRPVSRAEG